MNRREFLCSTAVATFAASPLALALEADNEYRRNMGLQLYTLRNELAKDTPGTIKAVVAAGYKQGEMAGFPNCDPVIAAAKESGLGLHSSHFEWDSVINPKDDGLLRLPAHYREGQGNRADSSRDPLPCGQGPQDTG